jgi:hypothetical protein
MHWKIKLALKSRRGMRSAIGLLLLATVMAALGFVYRSHFLPADKARVVAAGPRALPEAKKPKSKRKPSTVASGYRRWAALVAEPLKSNGTADLLGVELSQAGFELVERDQLEAITAEQQLQAFAATEGPHRVQLGKLLKADALLLLSTRKDGEKTFVRLIISDTRRGARLRVVELPAENPAAIAKAVVEMARETREHFVGGVKWVVAVPHFLSKDLTHDFDHLQSGFASLLETALSAAPGVAVLETEEATSIGKELDIGGEASVDRVVPLFVAGTYETHRVAPTAATQPGEAWPVQVTLSVVVSDGARVIRTFERKAVSLATAVDALSRELPAAILGAKLEDMSPLEPEQEFARLVARAEEFTNVGAWDHAVALREAALLIDPGDVKQRKRILRQVYAHDSQVANQFGEEKLRIALLRHVDACRA